MVEERGGDYHDLTTPFLAFTLSQFQCIEYSQRCSTYFANLFNLFTSRENAGEDSGSLQAKVS